ncbi:MAG TPA: DUF4169 family protein [Acetobacteraceae bacterium]|jgi:hypothetical protein
MGEIVNLRQARKRRARDEAAATAQENRTRHGRSPAQKAADAREEERRRALLDGVRRDDTEPGEKG